MLRHHARDADASSLSAYGARLGTPEMMEFALGAECHEPELHAFDAGGRRLDEVRFHPGYHALMAAGLEAGYAALAWEGGSGGHLTHAAMVYMATQIEPGHCCPMTMTYAAIPVLSAESALRAPWRRSLMSRRYDRAIAPVARKDGATLGMAMTEKQGGSDVRANATIAVPDGSTYRLSGHKWFCSAPMSDGFLTLAQAGGGLTCFLVPRWLDEGRNGIRIMRLKDKLGNRANASAEIEYHGAVAHRIGEEGAGIRTIIEMVHHTRLDTALAPAGLMRAALCEAYRWCSQRSVFQRHLIDQPLMRAVLADLCLDWEGALALGLDVARAFDDPQRRPYARIAVALAKFLNNKLCPNVTYEAMEALGGMGYTADTPMPMLYREAPLNSIWEGSGNVICLDILRTLSRDPLAADALRHRLETARGVNRDFDDALAAHGARWSELPAEGEARWYAASLAQLLTGSVLLAETPPAVSDLWCATRLAGRRGAVAGAIGATDVTALLGRLAPA